MRYLTFLLATLVLAGCAGPGSSLGLAPGTPRDQVVASAGKPTQIVSLPGGGERLQYSLQPLGRFAYMFDLDASGRLVRARQVLTAQEFSRIQPDTWTQGDVEREFGPAAEMHGVASWNGPVMTYRWRERNDDMFYWVYLDPQGVVRRSHPGMDFISGPGERAR
jgi:hypothetical protein